MDYWTFTTSFAQRMQAAFTSLRTNLIAAGVASNRITIQEVDSNNLRYQIIAVRGGRTVVIYAEVTPVGTINGAMSIALTLSVEGNGSAIATSYTANPPATYTDASGIDSVIAKLSQVETMTAGELLTAAKTFLQI